MKKSIMIVLMVLFSLTVWANDLTENGFLGNVEKVNEETNYFVEKFGKRIQSDLSDTKTVSIYNIMGNIFSTTKPPPDSWWWNDSLWVWFYDVKGNKIVRYGYKSDGALSSKTVYSYNDKRNMTEEAQYNADGSLDSKMVYTYDDNGNETEKAQYKSDGSVDSKMVYSYDDKGNMTEEAQYKSDGSLNSKTVYSYNDKGIMTEETQYKSDGSVDSKMVYSYDDKGNEMCSTYTSDGLLKLQSVSSHDAKGCNSEEFAQYDANGLVSQFKRLYFYDAHGNEIEEGEYNADGSLESKTVYAYEYDNVGNWTKKTFSNAVTKFGKSYFEKTEEVIRTIIYYP